MNVPVFLHSMPFDGDNWIHLSSKCLFTPHNHAYQKESNMNANNHNVSRFFISATIASLSLLFLFSKPGIAATAVKKISKTNIKYKIAFYSDICFAPHWKI